jgi:membrane protein insertase Oxa1/YidC/SpoIIIJ
MTESEQNVTSVLSVIALVCAILGGILYIMSIIAAIKRLRAHRKKNSHTGVAFVILATVCTVIAVLLYTGISLWWFIGIVVFDSVLIMLLNE